MEVFGKSALDSNLCFKDLVKGDVFYFLSEWGKNTDKKIYMRCGHTSELVAVNLETGISYNFIGDEPVAKVMGTFKIVGIENSKCGGI